jgi:hypothetical protein
MYECIKHIYHVIEGVPVSIRQSSQYPQTMAERPRSTFLTSFHSSMPRGCLSPVDRIVVSWGSLMSIVVILNHSGYGILSNFLVGRQLLSPCVRLRKDVMVVPPVVLFLSLILPTYLQLELSPEPSGIYELVDDPKFLVLYAYSQLGCGYPPGDSVIASS